VKLIIREIAFEAAHYLPGHDKCSRLHGHTYIIRNLVIEGEPVGGMLVDFNEIKSLIEDTFDHTVIVPRADEDKWREAFETLGLEPDYVAVSTPTVECIGQAIYLLLKKHYPEFQFSFELYEGLNQGVKIGR